MADKKISQLSAAITPLTGTELVPIVQSGTTVRTNVNDLGAAVGYTPAGTGAVATTVQTKLRENVSVKDFGAVGDGVTDDTAAIQAAIAYGKTYFKTVFFPDGNYLATLNNQTGRIFLQGTGNSKLIGKFTYNQPTFPTCADTLTPITSTAPLLNINGMNFQNNSGIALDIDIPYQGQFYCVCYIENCEFYGDTGMRIREVTESTFINLRFYNVRTGVDAQAITNCNFISCKFENQAAYGMRIIPNQNGYGGSRFRGGENARFNNCEWAVCTTGLYTELHGFLFMDNCLFDYCALPFYTCGNGYTQRSTIANSYFATSSTAISRFSGLSEYLAPYAEGYACIQRVNTLASAAQQDYLINTNFTNCAFVQYDSGKTTPLLYAEGVSLKRVEYISADGCVFSVPNSGLFNGSYVIGLSSVVFANVSNNQFCCNSGASLSDVYNVVDVEKLNSQGNDVIGYLNTVSGVIWPSQEQYEVKAGTTVVALNAGGDGTIAFGSFSNEILTAVVVNGDASVVPSAVFSVSAPFPNKYSINVHANGVSSTSVRINWFAYGR